MKKLILVLFATATMFAGFSAFAQDKFGEGAQREECIKYLDYYGQYYKQKNYDAALPNWRKAYSVCPPTASENMFIQGSTLITRLIAQNQKNPEYVQELVDTLLTLQDVRLATYPYTKKKIDGVVTSVDNKPTVLNNKGKYLIKYRGDRPDEIYPQLMEIYNELDISTDPDILQFLLQTASQNFQAGKMDAEEFLALYEREIATIDALRPSSPDDETRIALVRSNLQGIFVNSGVASCDNILAMFTPKYEADPENKELVSTIVKLMNTADNCLDNDLYLNAVTSLHRLDPSYQTAYFLYKLNNARGNVDAGIRYLEEAIASDESDVAKDAEYSFELANVYLKNNQRGKAMASAQRAAELDPAWQGKAYMLIGTLWSSASCGGNEIDRYARYWVAIDYMQKAKAADPSLTDDCNRYIGQFSATFPAAADMFMYDLHPGNAYTVSCGGMTATTTVRAR